MFVIVLNTYPIRLSSFLYLSCISFSLGW